MKKIIDISSHTTIKDYDALKRFDGVYIKATEGTSFTSRTLDKQAQECIKRNIPFGLYHFASNNNHTPEQEYKFFKSVCAKYPQRTLPDCLDYEQPDENVNWIYDFMSLDTDLIFYSYRSLINKLLIPKVKIWVAKPCTTIPETSGYLGVQYLLTYTGDTDIINYDLSVFNDSILPNNISEVLGMKTIKKGEKSLRVYMLQMLLNILNNANLNCDSSFGGLTETAVKNYQTKKGLEIDGKVGKNTKASLISDIENTLA